ncbi:PITH domain-containing protein 1 [Hondaea fermentalgiana]|uniref:PITH domain-containing protein 1 n=1 Tax=Hondaea fermentalgiana TaxID=2315210 RepID=A0A2R5GBB9_9STRA|nr:PITH domain-containing protein 1 [Hondaea fermentalgiana]|eukprot:GBG27895.1 PITH domain-containing protein 1 [Hondaea fermentalgiana]
MDCRDEAEEHDHHGHEGHGHSHGGGGHGHSHGTPDDPEGNSLLKFIDTGRITCLNEQVEGSGKTVFKTMMEKADDSRFVLSEEDDAELIFHIPFTVAVKLKSFCIIGGPNGEAPMHAKLFVNRDDVDFEMAHDLAPVQEFELAEDFAGAIDYPVKASKFSNITSLTIFIPENHGADSTRITFIGLKGEGTTARRGVVECTYEARAQLKDHESTRADASDARGELL